MGTTNWADAIRQKDFASIADWFTTYFFGVGIVGIVVAGIAAGLGPVHALGARVFALGLLMAGACTVSGWLFGLLFGIPRSLARGGNTQAQPNGSASSSGTSGSGAASRVNTNLEDISDWLTKTIVGVGLTQLTTLPKFLGDLSYSADTYGFVWYPYGHLLALSLILYFTPGGFWLGYVGTRTILTRLFAVFDSDEMGLTPEKVNLAAAPENLRLSDTGIQAGNRTLQTIDLTLLKTPVHALNNVTDIIAWAAAKARSGDLEAARVALESALQTDPTDEDIKRQLATIYAALKRFDEAADLLRGARAMPATVLSALYEDPPDGFMKAIKTAEQLLKDSSYKDDANLHVWLACAFAQKYGYEQKQGKTVEDLKDLKIKVLEEIASAIKIQPSSRDLLYSFWRPAQGAIDNDLSVFPPNDPEFGALLDPSS